MNNISVYIQIDNVPPCDTLFVQDYFKDLLCWSSPSLVYSNDIFKMFLLFYLHDKMKDDIISMGVHAIFWHF